MEFNLEIRKKQLDSLKQYIKSSEDNVAAVFHSLGWNLDKTIQMQQLTSKQVSCPINKNHLVTEHTISTHCEKCSLKSAGYSPEDQFLSDPLSDSKCNIKLSVAKKIEVFSGARSMKSDFKSAWNGREPDPLTSERFISTYSPDERLALYDYSVKHTDGPPKPEEFTLEVSDSKEKKTLTEKEKMMQERDSKRRRVKYKSVHTSKKSHTEVMRELIDNQMGLYVDWIKQKQEKERREKERLKRLAKEKMRKKADDHNKTQNYDEQYNQNYVTTQTVPYMSNYNSAYPAQPLASQGVITDWSHVYQGGIDTDIYSNLDEFQIDESNYSASSSNYLTEPIYQDYPSDIQPNSSINNTGHSSQNNKETTNVSLVEALRRGNRNLKH